jgi:Leucine-rich repeat (LRR) protein
MLLETAKIDTQSPIIQKVSPGFALRIEPLQAHLQEIYGFAFPDSFFLFWQFYSQLPAKSMGGGFGTALSITLGEIFDIFKTNVDLENFNPLLGFRHYNDPPEFFTLMHGDSDGLHWGYYLDNPDNQPIIDFPIASYYANDTFEICLQGYNLFEAVRYELEESYTSFAEPLAESTETEDIEFYQRKLGQLEIIRDILTNYCTAERLEIGRDYTQKYSLKRSFTAPTREGMGIVLPSELYKPLPEKDWFTDRNQGFDYHPTPEHIEKIAHKALELLAEGYPGAAFKLGKDLWTYPLFYKTCHQLLTEAYTALKRPILLKMLGFRQEKITEEVSEFQKALADAENTKVLYLRDKNLSSLSPKIQALKNLESLTLSFNNLETLPDEIANLLNLKDLYLNINLFTQFPWVLTQLPHLENLHIEENYLSNLPAEITQMQGLRELYLDDNKFQEFPRELCHLPNLRVLSLKSSHIQTLPHELEELIQLEEFYWQTDRKPKYLLAKMELLVHLQKFEFNYTEAKIENFSEEYLFPLEFCQFQNLRELSIQCNKFLKLPPEFAHLQTLETLKIDNYPWEEIPEVIFSLQNLKKLYISGSRLYAISHLIKNLSQLEDVYLYGNKISSLPVELLELTQLQTINLQNNALGDWQKTWLKESLPNVAIQV